MSGPPPYSVQTYQPGAGSAGEYRGPGAMPDSSTPPGQIVRNVEIRYAPRGTSWAVSLVFCCLMLGLLAALVRHEIALASNERHLAQALKTSLVLSQGHSEDVGKLLSDPVTQFIHLKPSDQSQVQHASLAWNAEKNAGALFCDELPIQPGGKPLGIFAIVDKSPVHVADIDAVPGDSVYPFRSVGTIGAIQGFEVRSAMSSTPLLTSNMKTE